MSSPFSGFISLVSILLLRLTRSSSQNATSVVQSPRQQIPDRESLICSLKPWTCWDVYLWESGGAAPADEMRRGATLETKNCQIWLVRWNQENDCLLLNSLSICSVEEDYAAGPESFNFLRWNCSVSEHKSCSAASTDRPGSTRGADSPHIRFLLSIRGLWLKIDEAMKGRWSVREMTAEEKRYNYLHLQSSNKADKHRRRQKLDI